MVHTLPDTLMARLSAFLRIQMGLSFPKSRWGDLERGLQSAARDLGFPDAEACARSLMSSSLSQRQVEVLASYITIPETYFFRDPEILHVAEKMILPDLVRQRRGGERRLRIWSAGCSSGEEPYTIAIILHRLLPDLANWHITILGTDINPAVLTKARNGVYGSWSFRGIPPAVRERYFRPAPAAGRYEVVPEIKKMVTFGYLNLAKDSYPSLATNTNAMDMILCRNVLMYFDAELAQEVAAKLHRSLLEGGWLLVSPAEVSQPAFALFHPVFSPEATVYRKEEGALLHSTPFEFVPEAPVPESAPQLPTQAPAASEASPHAERVASHATAAADYAQGRYAAAAEVLLHLLREKDSAQEYSLLVRCYANQGELELARSWCQRALTSYKMSAELHYLHAVILQEQNAPQEARAALNRALYLDPSFVLAHFALGNLVRREEGGRGERHLRNALSLVAALPADEPLPEGEGMTAGRLREVIEVTLSQS